MKELIAAAVQVAAAPRDVEKCCERGAEWLEKAVRETGAELIVFPECAASGYLVDATFDEVYELADEIPGRTTRRVQQAARDLGVHVVWSTYERSGGKLYNASVLIDDGGGIVGVYRKTHLFGSEAALITPGSAAQVYDTKLGRIGMTICYDGDFPELSRLLAVKGAEIITRTSAFLRPFDLWELTNRARAFDNHVYWVAANAVGVEARGNAHFYGHSMLVAPTGQRLGLAGAGEEIVAALLTPDVTWPQPFHHLRDRNLEIYA